MEHCESYFLYVLGFEKMFPGSLPDTHWPDRKMPGWKVYDIMQTIEPTKSNAPPALQVFGNSGLEHMRKYGTKQRHFTKIAAKNKRHSTNNPYSQGTAMTMVIFVPKSQNFSRKKEILCKNKFRIAISS